MSDDKPTELTAENVVAAAASLSPLDEPIVPARFFSAVASRSLDDLPAQFSRPFVPFEFPLSPGIQRSSYDLGRVREQGIDWNDFIDRDPFMRAAVADRIAEIEANALEIDLADFADFYLQPIQRSPTCGSRSRELRTALRELGEVEDILHDTIESGRVSALMSTASPDTVTELMRLANDIRDIIDPDVAFVRLSVRCTQYILRQPGAKSRLIESIDPRQRDEGLL